MTIYVASDLHLDEDDGSRLFHDERQGERLAALCRRATDERAELVLLGDTFDLTSMTPPPRGLERFARAVRIRLPQPRPAIPMIRSPGFRSVTPAPTSTTRPTNSWPI